MREGGTEIDGWSVRLRVEFIARGLVMWRFGNVKIGGWKIRGFLVT